MICCHIVRSNNHYYSIKIFPRFWLVKTTRIIHHNQLLLTKFGKNLRHIESMMSKVHSAADYWTDDVRVMSKVQPAADYWTVDWENLVMRLCYFGFGTWWKNLNSRPLNVTVVPLDVLFRMSDEHSRLCYAICACPLESLAFNLLFSTEKWKYINLYHKRSIAPAKRARRIDRL